MSMLSDAMSIFRTSPQAQQQAPVQQAPNNPGNLPSNAATTGNPAPGQEANGVIPPQQTPGTNNQAENPVDMFKGLFDNDPNKQAPQDTRIFGDIKPEDIQTKVAQLNFLSQITDADLTAINAGGPDATKTVLRLINSAGQQAFMHSSLLTKELIEQSHVRNNDRMNTNIDARFRSNTVKSSVSTSNALAKDPTTAPLVDLVTNQMLQKYPNATPQELDSMVNQYFEQVSSKLGAKTQQQQEQQNTSGEMDWENFLKDEFLS